jgi:hypothetical protein
MGGTAPLGLGGIASFGYGAFEWLELAIDLFGAWESFNLEGELPFNSVSYGGLLGLRLTRYDFPVHGLVPYLGAQTGVLFALVSSPSEPGGERVLQAYSVNGGASYRFTDRFGVFVDLRWIYARSWVADIAGRNVGGVLVTAGVSLFFPATPKRDLETPGFGRGPSF